MKKYFSFYHSVLLLLVLFVFLIVTCKPGEVFNSGKPGTTENLLDALINAPKQQPTRTGTWKYTFLSTSSYPGNMNTGGLAGADTICNNDPGKPADGGTFKAFLGANTVRAPGLADWPLNANQEYRRKDGVTVGITDANGVFTTLSSGLCSATSPTDAWTGMWVNGTTWQADIWMHCDLGSGASAWTINTATYSGYYGDMGSTAISSVVGFTSSTCDLAKPICCIEQ